MELKGETELIGKEKGKKLLEKHVLYPSQIICFFKARKHIYVIETSAVVKEKLCVARP